MFLVIYSPLNKNILLTCFYVNYEAYVGKKLVWSERHIHILDAESSFLVQKLNFATQSSWCPVVWCCRICLHCKTWGNRRVSVVYEQYTCEYMRTSDRGRALYRGLAIWGCYVGEGVDCASLLGLNAVVINVSKEIVIFIFGVKGCTLLGCASVQTVFLNRRWYDSVDLFNSFLVTNASWLFSLVVSPYWRLRLKQVCLVRLFWGVWATQPTL
jgi:hypothetical protein